MRYVDFDLELDSAGESGVYRALARASVSGQAHARFGLPFEVAEFELAAEAVAQMRVDPRQFTVAPSSTAQPEAPDLQAFGQVLFTAVLGQGQLHAIYEDCRRAAKRQGSSMRLLLRIRPPDLAALPWELLYDPERREYLTLSRGVSLVRYLEVAQPAEPLLVQPPVRVLGVVASPANLVRLDAVQEQQRLETALQPLLSQRLFELTWLIDPSWRELQTALRQHSYHVLHFIGHGGFDAARAEGFLALVHEDDGQAYRLSGDELGRLVEGHASLRLAVLNACDGARGSQNDGHGVAAALVQRGMPAVVAMQWPIRDSEAIQFARTFYEVIGEGRDIDLAVSEARIALSMVNRADYGWSTPVLHLRVADGRLFEFPSGPSPRYDVFLSYDESDRIQVEQLALALRDRGLKPWFDGWLPGGSLRHAETAAGIRTSRTCAFVVGSNGFGPWTRDELKLAQQRAERDPSFRLIPVLLPSVPTSFDVASQLPPLLVDRTWVDLRDQPRPDDGVAHLVSDIRGVPLDPSGALVDEESNTRPPYRGLNAFGEDDAEFFFGRDADVQRLVEKLKLSRFLAVLGSSGSGKSSLVRAGLVPSLRRGDLTESSSWAIRVLKPGARPLEELAVSVADLSGEADRVGAIRQMHRHLQEDAQALHLAIRLGLGDRADGARAVLVIDQFEEIFSLCRDDAERAQFVANLVYAGTVPEGACVVILTLRADFYQRCAAYPELAAQLAAHQYLVSPMSVASLRQAIEEPAHLVGLEFERGLVDAILEDVAAQPGALPLLEHALWELWLRRRGRTLTLAGYRDAEGVAGALAKRADQLYSQLTPAEQTTARRILLRLTEPGEGTEDTRRRASVTELVSRTDEAATVDAILTALADARLVITSVDEQTGGRTVDVAHEALIRGWPLLRMWIEDDREGLRLQARLAEAAQDWERAQREPSLLYRGTRLASANEWRKHNEDALNGAERAFLDASLALERGERRSAQIRLRATIGSLILALAVVTSLVLVDSHQTDLANQQRDFANREANLALSRQLAAQAISRTRDELDLALLLGDQAFQTEDTPEARVSVLDTLKASDAIAFLHLPGAAGGATFSPNGTLLVATAPGVIQIWDTGSRQSLGSIQDDRILGTSVAVNANGTALATPGLMPAYQGTRYVAVWSAQTQRLLGTLMPVHYGVPLLPNLNLGLTGLPGSLAFSPHDASLLAAVNDGDVELFDISKQEVSGVLSGDIDCTQPGAAGCLTSLAFSQDGSMLASGTVDGHVRLWDVTTRKPSGDPIDIGKANMVTSLAFSPDGQSLVVAASRSSSIPPGAATLQVWTVTTHQNLGSLLGVGNFVGSLAFSPVYTGRNYLSARRPNGAYLAASQPNGVQIWDLDSRLPVDFYNSLAGTVTSVAFAPDSSNPIMAATDQNAVELWDLRGRRPLATLAGAGEFTHVLAFSPDGQMLASTGLNGTVRFWSTSTREPEGTPFPAASAVAFSPDGTLLATANADDTIQLWDIATHHKVGPTIGEPSSLRVGTVTNLAFSPDGRLISWLEYGGDVHSAEVATGRVVSSSPIRPAATFTFIPDRTRSLLAMPLASDEVRLTDATTGETIGLVHGLSPGVHRAISFSRDGRVLGVASANTIQLWDMLTERPLNTLIGHFDAVNTLSFSPDGTILASGSNDRSVRLWDTQTQQPLGVLTTDEDTTYVSGVAFSPDGNLLAVGEFGVPIQLWDVSIKSWVARACSIANRNLSLAEWNQFIGSDKPYHRTCSELPAGDGAPPDAP
jgi:WD40 repeat protein